MNQSVKLFPNFIPKYFWIFRNKTPCVVYVTRGVDLRPNIHTLCIIWSILMNFFISPSNIWIIPSYDDMKGGNIVITTDWCSSSHHSHWVSLTVCLSVLTRLLGSHKINIQIQNITMNLNSSESLAAAEHGGCGTNRNNYKIVCLPSPPLPPPVLYMYLHSLRLYCLVLW